MGAPAFDDDLWGVFREHRNGNTLANALYNQYGNGTCVVTDEEWNYVAPGDEPGSLAAQKIDRSTFQYKPAQSVKIGRCLRALVTKEHLPTIPVADIERLSNAIKAWQEARANAWEVVRGSCIADVYRHGPSSCMKGKGNDRYALYTQNPATIGILIYRDPLSRDILARALVWTGDDGHVYVDRAYGSDSMIVAVANEAKKRCWYKRAYDDYDLGHTELWNPPDGGVVETRLVTVTLTGSDYPEYPYMDTFHVLDEEKDTISNLRIHDDTEDIDNETQLWLRNTDGKPSNRYVCVFCDETSHTHDDVRSTEDGWSCHACHQDYCCHDCNTTRGVEDGYCRRCRPRHTCSACDEVTDGYLANDTYDEDRWYCTACAGERRCADCDTVAERRDEDGMCRICAPRCVDCQVRIERPTDTYCAGCVRAHTCTHCSTVRAPHDPMRDGECSACVRGRICGDCGEVTPHGEMFAVTILDGPYFGRRRLPYRTRRCRSCERRRLGRMVTHIGRRVEPGVPDETPF